MIMFLFGTILDIYKLIAGKNADLMDNIIANSIKIIVVDKSGNQTSIIFKININPPVVKLQADEFKFADLTACGGADKVL